MISDVKVESMKKWNLLQITLCMSLVFFIARIIRDVLMKSQVITILFVLISPILLYGQHTPTADVSVGYSFLFLPKGDTLSLNGGNTGATFYINDWLGIAGEFAAYDGSLGIPGLIGETYMIGPRFSYRHWNRVTPFAQALVGGGHANTA